MNFTRIANEYGPEIGAMATLMFVASVELICEIGSGDYAVACITRPAAGSSLLLAVLLALNIAWFECRRSAKAGHER
jgi:hypothetical protein